MGKQGRSALMHAIGATEGATAIRSMEIHDICELLLAHGAAINHQDANGCTALVLAAISGSSATLPMLLAAGADTQLRDAFDSTALDYARAEGHELPTQLLQAAGQAEEARVKRDLEKKRYEKAAELIAAEKEQNLRQ